MTAPSRSWILNNYTSLLRASMSGFRLIAREGDGGGTTVVLQILAVGIALPRKEATTEYVKGWTCSSRRGMQASSPSRKWERAMGGIGHNDATPSAMNTMDVSLLLVGTTCCYHRRGSQTAIYANNVLQTVTGLNAPWAPHSPSTTHMSNLPWGPSPVSSPFRHAMPWLPLRRQRATRERYPHRTLWQANVHDLTNKPTHETDVQHFNRSC